MKTLRDFVSAHERFVVAHRGSSGTAPENTLAAIREAIEVGARIIEVDVRLSADDKVLLLHDDVMGRTTSGKGSMKNMTYDELLSLDAGEWFDKKFAGEKIPLLEEALRLLKKNNCYVSIEVKPPGKHEDFKKRMSIILDVVRKEGMISNTLFASFHHSSLAYLKQEYPDVHTACINLPNDKRLPSEIAHAIGAEAFICSLRECTMKRCNDAKKHGLYVGVYAVNSLVSLEKVLKYPVAAIGTNFPAIIIAELNKGHQ